MGGRIVCLLAGGDLYTIGVDGKEYLFEMHSYCGPMPLRKRDLEGRTLGPRHPFWTAVSLWAAQGRRATGGGTGTPSRCVWDIPPDPTKDWVHLGGKNWRLKRSGDEFTKGSPDHHQG